MKKKVKLKYRRLNTTKSTDAKRICKSLPKIENRCSGTQEQKTSICFGIEKRIGPVALALKGCLSREKRKRA
ncbi:MAG: hypothetical protein ABOK23_12010 [Candidatus Methanoperedens sp.]|nr:hypothetical protein [Candidatus Methanoperedens sp.]MCZ7395271.1 hypothetical protein [Candidatus Methanoperedens sp.]